METDRAPLPAPLRNIDLNLFVTFETIYSEGRLTAAASRLGLTQPAVSHALTRLRGVLNDRLFIRQKGRFVPTPFARHIIDDVRRALSILQERIEAPGRFDPGDATTVFYLALREGLEASLLPSVVRRLRAEAPQVSIVSTSVGRRDIETELANGTIDLAVDVAAPVGIDIRRTLLEKDERLAVSRPGHPMLRDGMTLESYLACGHVQISSRRRGGALEDFDLNQMGLKRHIVLRCHSTLTALQTIAETDLLLTVGRRQLAPFIDRMPLDIFVLPFPSSAVDLQLYWHSSADSDPANKWLRSIISQSDGMNAAK